MTVTKSLPMSQSNSPLRTVVALLVAAGTGIRAGGGLPKQYRILGDQAVIRHAVGHFFACPAITHVRVVFNDEHQYLYDQALADLQDDPRLLSPVAGGAERQDSVRLGLESLASLAPDVVLIHDAVRPFVTSTLISAVIDVTTKSNNAGAIPALPVVDTLKRADPESRIAETVDRTALWLAQTPQAFRYDAILSAHQDAKGNMLTDDAAVAEFAGLPVELITGDPGNIKFTTQEDFNAASQPQTRHSGSPSLLSDIRVGTGFDVHRFGPGDHVTLCGIRIPHDKGLAGYSDADVGLHALTDALLGAIGAGDIGDHFPPTDKKWANAPSDLFLKHACNLVGQAGGTILNLDLTLICERPKIKPHREAMRGRVTEILRLDPSRVSVKATTTEKLGFTGRGEGLAAQAMATVCVKPSGG